MVPISIISNSSGVYYDNLTFSGITCMEDDVFYEGYSGKANINDFVLFEDVGAYSFVLKPPFITLNVPIVQYPEMIEIKRREYIDDVLDLYY